MSGDVQPRKRKEKRRRREEDEGSAVAAPSGRSGSTDQTETLTIHIQKEGGTGGHWCARIIFFALLTALIGVVGLIILEHRGTTDVEAPATASQWAKIFEGWVDESPSSHGEHTESEAEAREGGDEDESHEGGDREEKEEGERGREDEEEDVAEEDAGSVEDDAEDEAECSQEDVQADEEEDRKALEDKTESEEAGDDAYESEGIHDDSREKVSSDNEDEGFMEESFDIDDKLGALEELEDENEEQEAEEPSETLDAELDFSIEGVKHADPDDEINFNAVVSGLNDIDDNSAEPLEEIDGEEPEEMINEEVNEEEEQVEEELEDKSTSLAMKFGVGVALIITAHFVLVRRRNNADLNASAILNNSHEIPDLTRRCTLIPPFFAKETDGEAQESNEQFEELQSTYKKVGSKEKKRSGIEEIFAIKTADLEQTLRGESKELKVKKPAEDDEEEPLDDEEYSEYEEEDYESEEEVEDEEIDGEEYADEEEEEEEELEDEEEEEEEEGDIEDIDDTELVEKLDKKYGKLPTPPYTDDEEVDEEADEEVESDKGKHDDEEAELSEWKHVRVPKRQ